MENSVLDKLKEECENFHYAQSSKVSTLARTIVYGIIGTIWVIVYSSSTKQLELPCTILMICLASCFVYLLFDMIHYFADAVCYREESFRMDNNTIPQHEKYMNKISTISFIMFCVKFGITIAIAILFIVGVLRQFAIF